MSLGFDGPVQIVDDAIQTLIDAGITVVLSAGNDNIDAGTVSPARLPDAITVAASTINNEAAVFSNIGAVIGNIVFISQSNTPRLTVTNRYLGSWTGCYIRWKHRSN